MIPALANFPVIYTQNVAWGDMDAFQHVNNVQYYRYIESARIEYLQQCQLLKHDFYTVVASSHCQYLSPVVYPDTLLIGARVVELRRSGLRMQYSLFSQSQQKIVAQGEAVMVFIEQNSHQKTAIPDQVRARIQEFEVSAGHIL